MINTGNPRDKCVIHGVVKSTGEDTRVKGIEEYRNNDQIKRVKVVNLNPYAIEVYYKQDVKRINSLAKEKNIPLTKIEMFNLAKIPPHNYIYLYNRQNNLPMLKEDWLFFRQVGTLENLHAAQLVVDRPIIVSGAAEFCNDGMLVRSATHALGSLTVTNKYGVTVKIQHGKENIGTIESRQTVLLTPSKGFDIKSPLLIIPVNKEWDVTTVPFPDGKKIDHVVLGTVEVSSE